MIWFAVDDFTDEYLQVTAYPPLQTAHQPSKLKCPDNPPISTDGDRVWHW